jgi:hypothetical protein
MSNCSNEVRAEGESGLSFRARQMSRTMAEQAAVELDSAWSAYTVGVLNRAERDADLAPAKDGSRFGSQMIFVLINIPSELWSYGCAASGLRNGVSQDIGIPGPPWSADVEGTPGHHRCCQGGPQPGGGGGPGLRGFAGLGVAAGGPLPGRG